MAGRRQEPVIGWYEGGALTSLAGSGRGGGSEEAVDVEQAVGAAEVAWAIEAAVEVAQSEGCMEVVEQDASEKAAKEAEGGGG